MSETQRCSILLLDLHARDDGFVGDAALGATAARLRERGHAVAWVRSVRDATTEGAAAWLARIARAVRERPADLVVLPRAWERAVIDAIRGEIAQSARLVRLTGGVAAAIDTAFDHVVDEPGLLALAAGSLPEARPLWQPTRARELRRLPRVDSTGPEETAESLDEAPVSRRPTISGLASGCPFLLDVRKNAQFDRARIDATTIQTRGCSFCLDNHGAYVVPSEHDVVQSWLAQWRSIRSSDPHAREVLLTDERPHPFLPAFFNAIAREPALAGIEVMIKSRVDWLHEFAPTALVAALESAETSGSVLHLYLVGFESFDAFHLELFNKGVTVEDNVRAITTLREFERRFPRSFEFRKYRAHGIVLFTPWTSPESLLENARWMRTVGFDELRTETLRTRLRLYPRTPLHALASADGLLAQDFGERGDRAVEQGYDASVPWRFRDGRVEAIQRITTEMARADRSAAEPRVLEVATHFVLRWPGLSAAPSDAWLPIRYAAGLAGPLTERGQDPLGPIAAAFDPEIEAIALGLKRASLKEGVHADAAEALARAYRAMGLHAEVVGLHGFEVGSGTHTAGEGFATVAVAARATDLQAVLKLQRAHSSGARAPVDAMGEWMGYPPCCVAAFASQRDRGDNLENERAMFLRAPGESLDPLVQRLARARLISHHACTPSCVPSRAFAAAMLARIDEIEPASGVWLRRVLSRPVLVIDYDRRIELDGAWEGSSFRVDRAVVLDERQSLGVRVDDVVRIEVQRDGVRFELRDGRTHRIPANRPLLLTPGAPMNPAALRAIAPAEAGPERLAHEVLPRLPAAIRVGATARSHRIASVRAHAGHHEIVLSNGHDRVRLEIRGLPDERRPVPGTDPWTISVEHAESLSEDARAAVTVFARALAAATRLEAR